MKNVTIFLKASEKINFIDTNNAKERRKDLPAFVTTYLWAETFISK